MIGHHQDKVRAGVADALAPLFDGARIMVGGFGLCGNAEALIDGVVARGVKDLHLISNNAGNMGQGLVSWLRAGIVSRVTCTYLGNNQDLHDARESGDIDLEIVPQGTFVERMRAAGAGIPAFYTPTGVGTIVAEGKETREFDGREYLLEQALHADFALIRCHRADTFGNARFWRTTRNFSPIMATAAKSTLLETDRLVSLGEIDPDDVHLPGIFVHHVIEVTEHEDPFEYRTTRKASA